MRGTTLFNRLLTAVFLWAFVSSGLPAETATSSNKVCLLFWGCPAGSTSIFASILSKLDPFLNLPSTSTTSSSIKTTSTTSSVKTTSTTSSVKTTSTSSPIVASSTPYSSIKPSTSAVASPASTSSVRASSVAASSSSSSITSTSAVVVSSTKVSSSASISSSSSSVQSSSSLTASSSSQSSSSAASSSSSSSSSASVSSSATVSSSSSASISSSSTSSSVSPSATPSLKKNVSGKILVLARDTTSAYSGTSGLKGYGIPYEVVTVPKTGFTLPVLNSSATDGNYGGIILLSEVSYDFGGTIGFVSAITAAQFQQIYAYQVAFGVRMVRLDVFPTADFGVTTAISGAGCCGTGIEQLISISNSTGFPTANLVTGATVTTQGLFHYPATITDSTIAWEVARFAPSSDNTFTTSSTAAVINNIAGRQQMVWFTSWATEWSPTSNFLQHAYIHWVTRGMFAGRRRTFFNTQIDDMHLTTELYSPAGVGFRLRPADLDAHVTWQAALNKRLPAGSDYFVEIGHNGNGDIIAAIDGGASTAICNPSSAIDYPEQIDTALEFQKPIGTGVDIWGVSPAAYAWSITCALRDPLLTWFHTPANRDAFAHISHTFSHESLNNATFSDANKEIVFNQAWLDQVGISAGKRFSPHGLIPPAITGLHNGDAIRAWMTNGIVNVVGDNTRPVLLNTENEFWPLISTEAGNGYAGLTIMPRWATTIFYNCDLPACTTAEWIATSGGSGDFTNLLNDARATNIRHLLGLHHDAFMFHQANMRQSDVASTTVGSQTGQFSVFQIWVETILQELTRLTTWPVISITHDQAAVEFTNRMKLDKCNSAISYTVSADGQTITDVTVGATGNTCDVKVPVTFPVAATASASGATSEQVGSDPLTIWTPLSGSAVTFKLSSPVAI